MTLRLAFEQSFFGSRMDFAAPFAEGLCAEQLCGRESNFAMKFASDLHSLTGRHIPKLDVAVNAANPSDNPNATFHSSLDKLQRITAYNGTSFRAVAADGPKISAPGDRILFRPQLLADAPVKRISGTYVDK